MRIFRKPICLRVGAVFENRTFFSKLNKTAKNQSHELTKFRDEKINVPKYRSKFQWKFTFVQRSNGIIQIYLAFVVSDFN